MSPSKAFAEIEAPQSTNYGLDEITSIGIGTQETDLEDIIARIINIILGFLGIIAVIIILVGGFKWMTAAGNDEQVGEAKKMIIQAVVGLAIIFLAWVIAAFVIDKMKDITDV